MVGYAEGPAAELQGHTVSSDATKSSCIAAASKTAFCVGLYCAMQQIARAPKATFALSGEVWQSR
jgi:hypothetical protein